jgi:DNA transposition AAA+ family ATPase
MSLLERSGMSLAAIAEKAQVSRATVSQVVNGKYKGRPEVVSQVMDVLGEFAQVPAMAEVDDELTTGQKQAHALLNLARENRNMAIILGESGTGKSEMCERYQADHPGVDIVQAVQGQTPSDLTRSLCRTWHCPQGGTVSRRIERLESLAAGRFLIVDEADLLMEGRPDKQIIRLVEVFRRMYEGGAGVAMVGLPSLYHSLAKAGETYVFSRIAYMNRMPAPTLPRLRRFWTERTARWPQAAAITEAMVADARKRGYFRYLKNMAELVNSLGGDVDAALGMAFRPE